MSFIEPSLKIGITLAILFMSGKIPSLKEMLHMSLKVQEMWLLAIFNILIEMVEGPEDLESSSEEMISLISLGVEGYNNNGIIRTTYQV